MPPITSILSLPFKSLHLPPPDSFQGQTVLITGANTGVGLETARHIVALGATKVILGVRTLSKGLSAAKDIENTTDCFNVIEVWEVDLASFASVKAFGARAKRLEKLDTAIMNAGLASMKWNITEDVWETQLQVNVLSTTLLSLLLLPLLLNTKNSYPETTPHLVLLTSDMQLDSKLAERDDPNILNALNSHENWLSTTAAAPAERYATTKLLDLYVMLELARISSSYGKQSNVVVNGVTPGFCKSELLSREEAPMALKVIQFLTARTTSEGARTIVDAALQGSDSHGAYLDHQKVAQMGSLVTSEGGVLAREKVWKEIVEVLRRVAPEISDLV